MWYAGSQASKADWGISGLKQDLDRGALKGASDPAVSLGQSTKGELGTVGEWPWAPPLALGDGEAEGLGICPALMAWALDQAHGVAQAVQ